MLQSSKSQILRMAAAVVGMAPLWVYFRAHHLSYLTVTLDRPAQVTQAAYTTFAIAFALLTVALIALSSRPGKHLDKPRAVWGLGACGVLGELLLWIGSPGFAEIVVTSAGALLSAVYFVLFLVLFGRLLIGFDLRQASIVSFTSFGLCFLSNLIHFLPTWVQGAVWVLSPAVTAGCLVFARASACSDNNGAPASIGSADGSKRPMEALASMGVPVALVVLLALFCLTGNIVRGVTDPWFVYEGPTWRSLAMTALNILAAAVAVVLLVRGTEVRKVLFWNWTLFMVLFFVGLFVLVFAPHDIGQFGSDLMTSARVTFTLLMFLFALQATHNPDDFGSVAGLILFVPESASGIVRFIFVPLMFRETSVEPSVAVGIVSVAIVLVLMIAIVVVLSYILLRQTQLPQDVVVAPASERDEPDAGEAALLAVAARYGLTERETQTARYISTGYSLEKTAELLGVSINTVRTHSRSIYTKLGIHARQDLIDIIDAAKATPGV